MNLLLSTMFVIGNLLVPAAAYAADKPAAQSPNDDVIESSVTITIKTEFAKDNTFSATNIKLEPEEGGWLTLAGLAKSKEEADPAVELARVPSGVT